MISIRGPGFLDEDDTENTGQGSGQGGVGQNNQPDFPTINDIEPYTEPGAGDDATYQAPETPDIDIGTPKGPGFAAPEDLYRGPKEGDTVAGRLSGMLESGSPYITAAEEKARRDAQARGLSNSSIAVGAGRKAAIESALPIATSDALTKHEALMGEQTGLLQGALATQKYEGEAGLVGTKANASAQLTTLEYENKAAMAAWEGAIAKGASKQDAIEALQQVYYEALLKDGLDENTATREATRMADAFDYDTQKQEQKAVDDMELRTLIESGALKRAQLDVDSRALIEGMDLTSRERIDLIGTITKLNDNYSTRYAQIQADPGMGAAAKTTALDDLKTLRDNAINLAANLAGFEFDIIPDTGDGTGDDGGGFEGTGTPSAEEAMIAKWESIVQSGNANFASFYTFINENKSKPGFQGWMDKYGATWV